MSYRNGGYESSPLIGKYCGEKIPSPILSHSHVLRLEFRTDGSMSAPGFEINFDSASTGNGTALVLIFLKSVASYRASKKNLDSYGIHSRIYVAKRQATNTRVPS